MLVKDNPANVLYRWVEGGAERGVSGSVSGEVDGGVGSFNDNPAKVLYRWVEAISSTLFLAVGGWVNDAVGDEVGRGVVDRWSPKDNPANVLYR